MPPPSVRELLGSECGSHLNWPVFTKVDDTIGSLTRVYPGIKANAAIFSHPNAWPIIAEAMLGRGDEAVAFYDSVLPYNQNDTIEVRNPDHVSSGVASMTVDGVDHPLSQPIPASLRAPRSPWW